MFKTFKRFRKGRFFSNFYLPFTDVVVEEGEVEVESILSSAENAQVMCYITRYFGVTFKNCLSGTSKRLQGTVIFRGVFRRYTRTSNSVEIEEALIEHFGLILVLLFYHWRVTQKKADN